MQQVQQLLDDKHTELADWRAEVAVTWALYYLHSGIDGKEMWRKIARAQRLEPDNERLIEVIELIRTGRVQVSK